MEEIPMGQYSSEFFFIFHFYIRLTFQQFGGDGVLLAVVSPGDLVDGGELALRHVVHQGQTAVVQLPGLSRAERHLPVQVDLVLVIPCLVGVVLLTWQREK